MAKKKHPEGLSSIQLQQVGEIATAIRKDVVACAGGVTAMCYAASKILGRRLKKAGFEVLYVEGTFAVDEPDPEVTSDAAFESGKAYTPVHHWIELGGLILDVTASQFNDEIEEPMPDIVLGVPEELWRYRAIKKSRA